MRLRKNLVYRKHIIADGIWGLLLILIGLPIVIVPAVVAHRYILLSKTSKTLSINTLDHHKLREELTQWTLAWRKGLALLNKQYLFPTFITLYLIVLLIQQTQLRDLNLNTRYLALNPNFILFLVIISWLGTIYEDPILDSYITTQESHSYYYWYIALSIALSLLGTYIVHNQVIQLSIIWIIISLLAWILIFLVGMMLLEEEKQE